MFVDDIVVSVLIAKEFHFGYFEEEISAICKGIGDKDNLSSDVIELSLEVVIIGSFFEVMTATVSVVIRVYEPHIINLV